MNIDIQTIYVMKLKDPFCRIKNKGKTQDFSFMLDRSDIIDNIRHTYVRVYRIPLPSITKEKLVSGIVNGIVNNL